VRNDAMVPSPSSSTPLERHQRLSGPCRAHAGSRLSTRSTCATCSTWTRTMISSCRSAKCRCSASSFFSSPAPSDRRTTIGSSTPAECLHYDATPARGACSTLAVSRRAEYRSASWPVSVKSCSRIDDGVVVRANRVQPRRRWPALKRMRISARSVSMRACAVSPPLSFKPRSASHRLCSTAFTRRLRRRRQLIVVRARRHRAGYEGRSLIVRDASRHAACSYKAQGRAAGMTTDGI